MTRAAALLLLACALAVWFVAAGARPAARVHIRFAGILFAALSLAAIAAPGVAPPVALLVLPIALGVLALAAAAGFLRAPPPAIAAVTLAAICLAGLGAAITGLALFSLAPAAAAIVAIGALCIRQFDAARGASVQGTLSALCFLAAACAFTGDGVDTAQLLFSAAGLLGTALALSRSDVAAEERPARDLRGVGAIGGRRQA